MLTLYPVVGVKYSITEWDGTKDKVLVRETSKEKSSVTFEYQDGLTHEVSADYFAFGLWACGVR